MSQTLNQLLIIMKTLRDPIKGCEWDKQQTLASIVPHTLEEAYEVADTIENQDLNNLKHELGDLLFQVIFYSQIAKEQGLFDFEEVMSSLNNKLIRRHPHVFNKQNDDKHSLEQLEQQWQVIKEQERKTTANENDALWSDIPKVLPALSRALKIQKRAAALGFDWPNYHGALDKVEEELTEVKEALADDPHSAHSAEEIGDLLFATVNVARHTHHDPEQVLRQASEKFLGRFRQVEGVLNEQGMSLNRANLEQMDAAWDEVKRRQETK